MLSDVYNNKKETEQKVYDSYNEIVFNKDMRVFSKMIKKTELYLSVKDIFGDIVECGVFKGAGVALWLKLREIYEPNSLTKIIGFDFFEPTKLLSDLSSNNAVLMENIINRVDSHDLSIESVRTRLSSYNSENYIIIKGNAIDKSSEYYNHNVGAKIKILYMDLDLGEPTYQIIKNLWPKISKGGIIICDEYGFHGWDESVGVDKFLSELEEKHYHVFNTNIVSPSFVIKKL